eukprot:c22540_g1_i1 orf=142-537(-)
MNIHEFLTYSAFTPWQIGSYAPTYIQTEHIANLVPTIIHCSSLHFAHYLSLKPYPAKDMHNLSKHRSLVLGTQSWYHHPQQRSHQISKEEKTAPALKLPESLSFHTLLKTKQTRESCEWEAKALRRPLRMF